MTGREFRAAVIGLGVGERHIAGFEQDHRCRVVALCDIDVEKLRSVGARHAGCRLTHDARDILEDPSIDMVSIASYDEAHYDQVISALAHGKHVFVEKPLCQNAEELSGIRAALAARPDLRLSSNLILRRTPRFLDLYRRVRAGALGDLYLLEAEYNYGRFEKITSGWRGRQAYYSVMHGGGIHMIDLLLWLSGQRPNEVFAYGSKVAGEGTAFKFNDTVAAVLKFPSGMVGRVTANFPCVVPHHHALALYGTDATFIHNIVGARMFTSKYPDAMPEIIDTPYPGAAKGDMVPRFVSAVIDGGTPEVDADDVMAAMAVSIAIERSANSGLPVNVDYLPAQAATRVT